ncbi:MULTISPECIES: Tim44/TimA family putative adaptor protein [Pseudovibrio]|uniref:Tim44/TimA family putative adaptor protein n=1 Tax=Stappiaceae TaxID=2821832 RepID=UPI002365B6CA|nr:MULTISPECIES: Tim44/TimA family putative adaptor protein [Pseudovibrio]MDD7909562.1 Tim44/TimA family putative adaptor protein [Pseudovibrio exalbescens]MDX5595085.1 Tim44/TimA family putative adaptor protein [Pseudovibrio sp. SPO723]
MSEIFDVTNIIILVVAVVIFLRLRSVLGKRTGNENPPYDPYSAQPGKDAQHAPQGQSGDNVIQLPGSAQQPAGVNANEAQELAEEAIDQMAPVNTPLNDNLRAILAAEPGFNPKEFLQGAGAAYEMIVTAFAQGDRKTLKSLLSEDVYEGFVAAIEAREARKERVDFTFIGIQKASISDAELKDKVAQLTLKIKSQLITATRGPEGHIVEGDPTNVTEVTDIWTFSRETGTPDPNWKLVATESGE